MESPAHAALFDGPNGLEQLFDQPIDMRPGDRSLTAVEQTYLKQYCSLIHGQAIIDATLAIRSDHRLLGSDVASVNLEVFQGAYDFAGGGSYGDKDRPPTKEQADYNLKYLSAVALLDGQVGPEQLETERIDRADVQDLLARVDVKPAPDLSAAYPERTSARINVVTRDGRIVSRAVRFRGLADTADVVGPRGREVRLARRAVLDDVLRAEIISAVEQSRPDSRLRTRRPVVGGEPDVRRVPHKGPTLSRSLTPLTYRPLVCKFAPSVPK